MEPSDDYICDLVTFAGTECEVQKKMIILASKHF